MAIKKGNPSKTPLRVALAAAKAPTLERMAKEMEVAPAKVGDLHLFRTTALFDFLRRQSRLEGRKDRQLGVRLAELALLSLECCAEAWTDRGYELRAEGLICLGNARRLAGELLRSNADFEAAWAAWRVERRNRDPRVAAKIYLNQGTLRMLQRRYDQALEMIERALAVYEREGDTEGQIEALIQRASIRGYTDQIEESIRDLQMALDLTDQSEGLFLTFTLYKNLANAYGRAGDHELASENLALSLEHSPEEDYPLERAKVTWLRAFIKELAGQPEEAEPLYREARSVYIEAGEASSGALLGLDIAALCSEKGWHTSVLDLMAEALPVLESLQFHEETLAALALLSRAVTAPSCRGSSPHAGTSASAAP